MLRHSCSAALAAQGVSCVSEGETASVTRGMQVCVCVCVRTCVLACLSLSELRRRTTLPAYSVPEGRRVKVSFVQSSPSRGKLNVI